MGIKKLKELAKAKESAKNDYKKAFIASRTAAYEAERRSLTDELTGLGNYRAYQMKLKEEISRVDRYGGRFSLVLIDLDGFKAYNDSHGHDAGDTLLKNVGSSITNRIRKTDSAYRKGGDEYALILPNTQKKGAFVVAEELRKEIEKLSEEVTASIGFEAYPNGDILMNELTKEADKHLYHVKESGGNAVYPIIRE